VARLKLLSLLRPKFSAVPQILLLSPRRPSYRRAADARWFDTAPPILASLVLLHRSSLVWYCSVVHRSSMDASQDGDGGQGGNGGGGQGGKTDHAHQAKKKKNGRDGRKCKPGHGRDGTITNKYTREKDHGQGIQITPSTQLTSLYFGCHIIIFWLSSWPHVNNLGFCLEILNNAIIAALVDISLPSNPEDMLSFMLSSTLICQDAVLQGDL
jgi:hypothetical protein